MCKILTIFSIGLLSKSRSPTSSGGRRRCSAHFSFCYLLTSSVSLIFRLLLPHSRRREISNICFMRTRFSLTTLKHVNTGIWIFSLSGLFLSRHEVELSKNDQPASNTHFNQTIPSGSKICCTVIDSKTSTKFWGFKPPLSDIRCMKCLSAFNCQFKNLPKFVGDSDFVNDKAMVIATAASKLWQKNSSHLIFLSTVVWGVCLGR